MQYVFVLGGGYSGLGKGIVTASIGRLLKNYGFDVRLIKVDPYLNEGAGDQNPNEHGEVFVTEDGGEIDQDFGHYERFLGEPCFAHCNITSGKIYGSILHKGKHGFYLGKSIQLIPHVRDEVKEFIKKAANNADIAVIEVGGTVGDDEALIFLRAIDSMIHEDKEECVLVLLVPIVFNKPVGEPKTKIAQTAVQMLNQLGLDADFLVASVEKSEHVDDKRKNKLHMFCKVAKEDIIVDPFVSNIYRIPLLFHKQNFGKRILQKLGCKPRKSNWEGYDRYLRKAETAKDPVDIAYIGKYVSEGKGIHKDAYISVEEAIGRAAIEFGLKPRIHRIEATLIEEGKRKIDCLNGMAGIIVPGGYGSRGILGKIQAIKYARENRIPFLGLCWGLQLAVVEFANNVLGLDVHSDEQDEGSNHKGHRHIICPLPEQERIRIEQGYIGTQRLGDFACVIEKGPIRHLYEKLGRPTKYEKEKLSRYKKEEQVRVGILKAGDFVVLERHRHRREVNPEYLDILIKNGLTFPGTHKMVDGTILGEIIQLKQHPFFVASQFHPEFTSDYKNPNPLFYGFMEAVKKSLE